MYQGKMLYNIKLQVCIQKIQLKIKRLILMLARKWQGYGKDNTKQAEMPYFHCSPSRQEKLLIRLGQNGEKFNIKK